MIVLIAAISCALASPPDTVRVQAAQAVKDTRVTVHFKATAPDGKILADTERRGMAFTFLMDQDTVEPFWHREVRGMRVGDVRTTTVRASEAGVAIQGDPALALTVRLLKVAPI